MSSVDLRPEDVIIHDMRLNYTNKVGSYSPFYVFWCVTSAVLCLRTRTL